MVPCGVVRAWWLVVLACGCGRLGFDPSADAGPADAPGIDAPPRIRPGDLPPFGTPELVPFSLPDANEDDPSLTGDMLELYFSSNRGGDRDIYVARRAAVTDPWGDPEPVPELNTIANEENPKVSADGLTMYLCNGVGYDYNIFVARRASRAAPWSTPERVDALSSAERDTGASADASDRVLVLAIEIADDADLYEARRVGDAWQAPAPIAALNTPGDDGASPFLDPTGLVVYFEAGGAAHDIYYAERDALDAPWQPRVALDATINTSRDEGDPWVSPDHRTIYFARQDLTGNRDLFVATRP